MRPDERHNMGHEGPAAPRGVAGTGERYEADQPEPPQPQQPPMAPAPPVVGTLQALGQTNVPQLESNIYCLTIIGQIEGHLQLPPTTRRPSTNTSSRSWLPPNRIPTSRGSSSS
jgi:hypothetical protein